ncbi:hypothetical protein AB0M46_19135 [Dactylosporangium sp. NPDC051485]|uniref:hypothetical protein n=1 Tax=Dactylosporangium sp. NPDC051485 TaxID=3154846 RepID=UPI003428E466
MSAATTGTPAPRDDEVAAVLAVLQAVAAVAAAQERPAPAPSRRMPALRGPLPAVRDARAWRHSGWR